MKYLRIFVIAIIICSLVLTLPFYAVAAGVSDKLSEDNKITIKNYPQGTNDTVMVDNLQQGDVIKVYADDGVPTLLGKATANISGIASASIPQLVANDGDGSEFVLITVTNVGSTESGTLKVQVPLVKSDILTAANHIKATNNANANDTLSMDGLTPGDTIKVYSDNLLTSEIYSGVAATDTVIVSLPQLINGDGSGVVYVTVTKAGKSESDAVNVTVPAPRVSAPLTSANLVTVTNNPAGTDDTIVVGGLQPNDKIKVYSDDKLQLACPYSTGVLNNGIANADGIATFSTNELIPPDGKTGFVFITVTNTGALESSAYPVAVPAMGITAPLSSANKVTVTNNAGADDTIVVEGLQDGDAITVYADAELKTPLGSEVIADKGVATFTVDKLIQPDDGPGIVYITVTSAGLLQSTAVAVKVPAVGVTDPLAASFNHPTVTNNPAGTSDTLVVINLTQGDIIRIYTDETMSSLIGSATATAKGVATFTTARFLPNDTSGIIYVTLTNIGKLESTPYPVAVPASGVTPPLSLANAIKVTNNAAGTSDTIVVNNLNPGDKINIYTDATLSSLIGSATASSLKTAKFTIAQLTPNDEAGFVYLTVTAAGSRESAGFEVAVPAGGTTAALTDSNIITVTNNAAGTSDTVVVNGLTQGDKIKIYADDTLLNLIGTATAVASKTEPVTYIATATVPQLAPGDTGGTIYITVTSAGLKESEAYAKTFIAANQSPQLTAANNITTTNCAGKSDTVIVNNLNPGDKIKVYSDVTMTNLLGTAIATSAKTATVSVPQLVLNDAAGGDIYITVTTPGKLESDPFKVTVKGADTSIEITDEKMITVTNNAAGTNDTVVVTNRAPGDLIKVYANPEMTILLGFATASGAGIATVSIPQISAGDIGGSVYVTVTSSGKSESSFIKKDFDPAKQTSKLDPNFNIITIVNNASGTNDTITIIRLAQGDKIKVYADSAGTVLLGSATASAAGTVTVTVPQLIAGDGDGNEFVYISVINKAALESQAIPVSVPTVDQTKGLLSSKNVTVTNYVAGTSDTVVVTGLSQKDLIKVYSDSQCTVLIGSATVAANGKATIKIAQITANDAGSTIDALGNEVDIYVYVTVTPPGQFESDAYAALVPTVKASDPLSSVNTFTVKNNASGTSDTIVITRLTQGDKVKVYADASLSVLLGTATAAASGPVTVTIPQLTPKDAAGAVYITVTNIGKLESTTGYKVDVPATLQSNKPSEANITVTNNAAGTNDTIVVEGLSQNDKVRVYGDAAKTTLIGTATAGADGKATLTVAQIIANDGSGSLYVTDTEAGRTESDTTKKDFDGAKTTSDLQNADNVTIVNNNTGTNDTIVITKLASGDKVKVYTDINKTKLLCSGTASTEGIASLSVAQLIPDANSKVYITLTNKGALESKPYGVIVPAVKMTSAISPANVKVTNNPVGTSDIVIVQSLAVGDKVTVYADAEKTARLGTATAGSSKSVTISIKQLPERAVTDPTTDPVGEVYVTVTNVGAIESSVTPPVSYYAVKPSTALTKDNIVSVKNNPLGTSDTIVFQHLVSGSKVYVYADSNKKALLGTTTANASGGATISVKQLIADDGEGYVYITVTSAGLAESTALPYFVSAVVSSDPVTDVKVTNNAVGTADTVAVTGLKQGDKVKVYSDIKLTKLLGTATAAAKGTGYAATVSVAQLVAQDAAGTVYVTVTSTGMKESGATTVTVPAVEQTTDLTDLSLITIVNNAAGTPDTVTVTGLAVGDKIKVYSDSKMTRLLGTATAVKASKPTGTPSATLKITQLTAGDAEGYIYITITSPGKLESKPIECHVDKAKVSSPIH